MIRFRVIGIGKCSLLSLTPRIIKTQMRSTLLELIISLISLKHRTMNNKSSKAIAATTKRIKASGQVEPFFWPTMKSSRLRICRAVKLSMPNNRHKSSKKSSWLTIMT